MKQDAKKPRTIMQLSHLGLNLLVGLDALLTEQNITAAGRRVHVTQSAMGGALSRLREFFGDELLTPVSRKKWFAPQWATASRRPYTTSW